MAAAAMAALAAWSLLDRHQAAQARAYADGGFVYTGALRNGLFDGRGEAVFADGARLKGYFSKGRVYAASYYPVDDWRFEGQFRDGQISGSFLLPNDVTATLSRAFDDTVEFASPKGWQYEGGIGERGQNGEGTYTFPGGESYTGGFLLGLAEGQGTYRNKDGAVIYEGQWKTGLYHGQGKYTGGDFVYEGAFEAGLPHGRVQYTQDGVLRYDGDFEGGVPQGQGIYYSPEGWTYEGGFANGVFHGAGTLTKDGQPTAARWEKGRQVAAGE